MSDQAEKPVSEILAVEESLRNASITKPNGELDSDIAEQSAAYNRVLAETAGNRAAATQAVEDIRLRQAADKKRARN